jgi:hypothetical protein
MSVIEEIDFKNLSRLAQRLWLVAPNATAMWQIYYIFLEAQKPSDLAHSLTASQQHTSHSIDPQSAHIFVRGWMCQRHPRWPHVSPANAFKTLTLASHVPLSQVEACVLTVKALAAPAQKARQDLEKDAQVFCAALATISFCDEWAHTPLKERLSKLLVLHLARKQESKDVSELLRNACAWFSQSPGVSLDGPIDSSYMVQWCNSLFMPCALRKHSYQVDARAWSMNLPHLLHTINRLGETISAILRVGLRGLEAERAKTACAVLWARYEKNAEEQAIYAYQSALAAYAFLSGPLTRPEEVERVTLCLPETLKYHAAELIRRAFYPMAGAADVPPHPLMCQEDAVLPLERVMVMALGCGQSLPKAKATLLGLTCVSFIVPLCLRNRPHTLASNLSRHFSSFHQEASEHEGVFVAWALHAPTVEEDEYWMRSWRLMEHVQGSMVEKAVAATAALLLRAAGDVPIGEHLTQVPQSALFTAESFPAYVEELLCLALARPGVVCLLVSAVALAVSGLPAVVCAVLANAKLPPSYTLAALGQGDTAVHIYRLHCLRVTLVALISDGYLPGQDVTPFTVWKTAAIMLSREKIQLPKELVALLGAVKVFPANGRPTAALTLRASGLKLTLHLPDPPILSAAWELPYVVESGPHRKWLGQRLDPWATYLE